MLKKLSLRERIKIWFENGIWLKRVKTRSTINEEYGMIIYESNDGGIWGVEKVEGQIKTTKISVKEYTFDYWKDYCYEWYDDEKQTGYIFGTKGIFYTKGKEEPWECIYSDEDISGILVNKQIGIVCIFRRKEKDIIYRINNGINWDKPLLSNMKIMKIKHYEQLNKNEIDVISGSMQVLVQNNDITYSYYYITKNEFNDSQIIFKTCKESRNFFDEQLVKAYSKIYSCDVLITLVNKNVKIHCSLSNNCADNFVQLRNNYYLAFLSKDSECHLLKYINAEKVEDMGPLPNDGKYAFIAEILGVDFYKVKNQNGITLLAVSENKLETMFYEDAIDIDISKPYLFQKGNILELKPVVLTQKVIENE